MATRRIPSTDNLPDTGAKNLPNAKNLPDTRSRILDAALGLFAAQGYYRTSLRQIAASLGMTKAAVLYHFPAKDKILTALTEPLLDDMEQALDAASRMPLEHAQWTMVEGILDVFLTHRQALLMARHDMAIVDQQPGVYQHFIDYGMRAHQLVAGADAGLPDLVRAAQVLAGLSDTVIYFPDTPVEQLRELILDGARRMLGGAPPTQQPTEHHSEATEHHGRPAEHHDKAAEHHDKATEHHDKATEHHDEVAEHHGRPAEHRGEVTGSQGGTAVPRPAPEPVPAEPTDDRGRAGRSRSGRSRAGRPRVLDAERLEIAKRMHAAGGHTVAEIAAAVGVSRATLYRHLGN